MVQIKTQPQVAQLELKFNAPLIKDSQTDSLETLLTLSYNYVHKVVWVKSEKKNYYLLTGDGSTINCWRPINQKATIDDIKQFYSDI